MSSSSSKATGSNRSIGASRTSNPRARRPAAVVSSSGCGRVSRTAMLYAAADRGFASTGDCTSRPHNARARSALDHFNAFSSRQPVATTDQVRRHASLENALAGEGKTPVSPITQGLKVGNDAPTLVPTLVLGIETTCDETAAAVVERLGDGSGRILSNIVRSQTEEHAAYGGVVPEIAARAHVDVLDGIIDSAMKEAGVSFAQLSGVAAAAGPGLIGGVIVGLTTAKAIAMVHNTPLIAVNHLEAHALTPRLTCDLAFPYCVFLASGGHTQIVAVIGVGQYVRLGTTVDDAMGEAFDKVAKMLGLPYPGGPEVERAARGGDPARFSLPRPMLGRPDANFSLSGLKTAVRNEASRLNPMEPQDIRDLCAGFQAAVLESTADRLSVGLRLFHEQFGPPRALVAAGGVAANQAIRSALQA